MSRLIPICAVLLLCVVTISAVDITGLLDQLPEYSEFSNLLTKTKVADEINHRGTITVLALTNDHIGDISGKSDDVQKKILSTHVVLDYYDTKKLTELEVNKTCVLTTLFQASGSAQGQQGFIHVIHNKDDSVLFGSAVKDAPIDARLEEAVASQPYDISVISVSHAIIAPGIDGPSAPVSPSTPAASPPPPTPSTPTPIAVPPPADPAAAKVSPPAAQTPEKSADAPAAVKVSPPAKSPATATADAPAASDQAPAEADDNQSPANSAGKQIVSGASLGLILAFASAFLA